MPKTYLGQYLHNIGHPNTHVQLGNIPFLRDAW